jgi:hypothetical protein
VLIVDLAEPFRSQAFQIQAEEPQQDSPYSPPIFGPLSQASFLQQLAASFSSLPPALPYSSSFAVEPSSIALSQVSIPTK